MLAVTCFVFVPALGSGHLLGQAVRGSVSPVGVSVIAGAFLFGVGMQLAAGARRARCTPPAAATRGCW